MKYFTNKIRWKASILLIAFIIILGFLKITNNLVDSFEEEERKKVELWAKGVAEISSNKNQDITFVTQVIVNNSTIPVILADSLNNILSFKNIDTLGRKPDYLNKNLLKMKEEHEPIIINIIGENYNYVYYKDSVLLTQLSYYPFVQLFIIVLFFGFAYIIFNSFRNEEQNKIWIGLSKETAHQLGTPTSSLLAWVEILKSSPVDTILTNELEKDVQRLEKITERFSKIGSFPSLKTENLVQVIQTSVNYIKRRVSNKVEIKIDSQNKNINIPLNKSLIDWVLENILKNAVDSMNGNGKIKITITDNIQVVFIDICDTGNGINKNQYKTIFKPGYTTKTRGWGLGLSLSKRIIEKYHFGKIFVKDSEINKGSCFRIVLKKQPKLKI